MPAHPWAFVPPCHLDNCSCIALPSHIHVGRMAPRHTTTMDGGSADIASLHGRNLLGQRICPWMDGSRAMQEQLPRSSCRGANICPYLLYIRLTAIHGSLSHTAHPWAFTALAHPCARGIPPIHGHSPLLRIHAPAVYLPSMGIKKGPTGFPVRPLIKDSILPSV